MNEACDTGGVSATCDADCTAVSCGDGFTNIPAGEQCDDGNMVNDDGCRNNCTRPLCGDGVTQLGAPFNEQCDDMNTTNTDACVNCLNAQCGDGAVRAGVEECDDGNAVNTDNCVKVGNLCKLAVCGDTFVDAAAPGVEQCDDGNLLSNDDCTAACLTNVCGDGFVDGAGPVTEPCDDGNTSNNDDCVKKVDNSCAVASCGDGFVDMLGPVTEACDPGGNAFTAMCDDDCSLPVCGDGKINAAAGEVCDNGVNNGAPGNACDISCKRTNGQACVLATECGSNFCADSVCCNVACDQGCESCLAADQTGGTTGTCGPVTTGTDPLPECPGVFDGTGDNCAGVNTCN